MLTQVSSTSKGYVVSYYDINRLMWINVKLFKSQGLAREFAFNILPFINS